MSSDRDERLKLTAILMLGAIGLFALFPYASGDDLSLDEEATMVAIGAAIGVIIVILSYRLTSLKITRD